MNFAAEASHRDLLDAVRALTDKSLAPGAAERDRTGLTPARTLQTLRDLGVLLLDAPESEGGLGLSPVGVVRVLQALAEADAGLAQLVAEHLAAAFAVRACGQTPGDGLLTLGHAEDLDHLDAPALRTEVVGSVAVAPGQRVQLQGDKPLVVGGALASKLVATAQTADGVGLFVVPLDGTGVERAAMQTLLGLRAAGIASVELDRAAATALASGQMAEQALVAALLRRQLWTAAVAVGVGRAALAAAGKYVQQREQFGKPIAAFQPVQWQIANSATELDAAWLLVGQAAGRLGAGAKSAARDVALAKCKATEAAQSSADRAIQLHGGYGYTRDYPVERHFRDAQVLVLLHGTPSACKVAAARGLAAGLH